MGSGFEKVYVLLSIARPVYDYPGHDGDILLTSSVDEREQLLEDSEELLAWPEIGEAQWLDL